MKKICFLIGDINHSGGTERVTTLIANGLGVNGHEIVVVSISGGETPFFKLNEEIRISNLFNKKVSLKINLFSAIVKLRKFLVENKIDTLIVVDSISCVITVPACIGLKVNHICWEHFNLKVDLGSSFRVLGRWMAAKWCDRIVTLTERDKDFWDEKFNKANKTIAISNPSPYSIQNNIPSLDYKTILCVGRLTYQKGFDLLIQAWAKIAEEAVGWKVIVVGTGEDEQDLIDMSKKYNICDSIEFVGQQKDMDKFYRKASVFCMSSRFEGLPMVLLEAQSYSLPIVSYDCDTGPAEVLTHNKNGFLVQSGAIDSLAEELKRITLLDTRSFEEMAFSAQKNCHNFDIKIIISKWMVII